MDDGSEEEAEDGAQEERARILQALQNMGVQHDEIEEDGRGRLMRSGFNLVRVLLSTRRLLNRFRQR